MRRLLRAFATLCLVMASSILACSSRDVVVFDVAPDDDLSSTDAGPDAGPVDAGDDATDAAGEDASDAEVPIVCKDLFDCPPYWYCVKDSCDQPTGVCEVRPVFCTWEPGPVCGCNGVTYWNDCLRKQLGSAAATPGQCQVNSIPCNYGGDCGFLGARCARLLFPDETCKENGPYSGTCWALPPDCNAVPDEQVWRHCPLPDEPEGYVPPCVNTCWAIYSELPHLQAQADTCE